MKSKNIKTLHALKGCLKKSLPKKISQVMESYETFSELSIPEDAKGFTAHHNACKSAVIHAETLLKLARWTTDEEDLYKEIAEPKNDLQEIIEEAQKEYDEFADEEY